MQISEEQHICGIYAILYSLDLKKIQTKLNELFITPFTGKDNIAVLNLLYALIKSLVLGMKCAFKHHYLQIFGLKSN